MRPSLLKLAATVTSVYIISLLLVHIYIQLSLDSPLPGQSEQLTDVVGQGSQRNAVDLYTLTAEVLQPEGGSIYKLGSEVSSSPGTAVLEKCPEEEKEVEIQGQMSQRRRRAPGWEKDPQKRHSWSLDERLYPSYSDCVDLYPEEFRTISVGFYSLGKDFLYSAYYDDRLAGQPFLRIIALLKKPHRTSSSEFFEDIFCHIPQTVRGTKTKPYQPFFANSASSSTFKNLSVSMTSVPATYYEMCENHGKDYGGWILSCNFSENFSRPPCAVYISRSGIFRQDDADAVRLSVFRTSSDRKKPEKDFGVCIPPIFGQITARTFIDFVELTRILGADHLYVYVPHPFPEEIRVALNRYVKLGSVTVIAWSIPVHENSVWYNGQLLAINDCLYRSMHAFRYVAFNDLDEFIVPHRHSDWRDMVEALRRTVATASPVHCGYSFKSAFFDPMTTSGTGNRVAYELDSNLRTRSFSRIRNKLIVSPRLLFELGIHHISRPVEVGSCSVILVDPSIGFIHHYRECTTSFDGKMNCQSLCQDDSMATYLGVLRRTKHSRNFTH